jgi:hypothetical protein
MSTSHRAQYEQMQEALLGFRSGTMLLSDLIDRLPTLLRGIENPPQAWRDEYVSYWWTLEQIHGQAIDLGESRRMPAESRQTVDDAIAGLERLVQGALATS